MATTYTPLAADALWDAFVGQPMDQRLPYPTASNRRADAQYFGKPVQDNILQAIKVACRGGGMFLAYNNTGGTVNAGPVKVNGFNALATNGEPIFTFAAADAAGQNAANAWLPANCLNATVTKIFFAYSGFLTALNLTAVTLNSPVYLAAGGGITLTAPTGVDQIQQIVGYTKDQLNPGNIAVVILPPNKLGSSWLQSGASGIFTFPEVDLKTAATTTLSLPTGYVNVDEVGVRLTTLGGTITTQPFISFGVTGSLTLYKGSVQTTLLSAIGRRERFTVLGGNDDRQNSLTFKVDTIAAGSSTIKGTPYMKGFYL